MSFSDQRSKIRFEKLAGLNENKNPLVDQLNEVRKLYDNDTELLEDFTRIIGGNDAVNYLKNLKSQKTQSKKGDYFGLG